MASSTTYGDWMRPIAGGIRNIGKPLTFAGLGVLVVTLMLSMVNVVAAIATAVIGIGTIAVLAVRDREHRNVLDRTVERRSWLSESRKGRALYRSGMLAPVESGECRLPGILSRVSLVEANDGFGDRLTLVRHGHTGEYSLLLACQPQGAALADDDVEDAYVASWAGLLEALGGEAGVTQLAVTVDTSPDSGVRFRRNLAKRTVKDAPELAARAMAQIMDLYATGGASSSVILTLTFRYVDVRDGKFLEPEDAARRIGQLVPNLIRRIADAGGGTARTLTIDEISRMVRVSYDPATQDTLEQADGQPWIEWEDAGPVACEAGWDHYRHDSGVSRTWEMCDPPKSNVTSSTLARLLGPLSDCDRKRVTVVFHVLPPDKTAFMAEQNRQRAANQVSQEKRASISAMSQINKANRQAIETNRGAAIVFFGMLVTATVRAGDDERMRLEQATHAVEGAAGSAKIDLRPCYGAQDTAFAASLPLGLNLRNYTPPSAFAALSGKERNHAEGKKHRPDHGSGHAGPSPVHPANADGAVLEGTALKGRRMGRAHAHDGRVLRHQHPGVRGILAVQHRHGAARRGRAHRTEHDDRRGRVLRSDQLVPRRHHRTAQHVRHGAARHRQIHVRAPPGVGHVRPRHERDHPRRPEAGLRRTRPAARRTGHPSGQRPGLHQPARPGRHP